jgi:hypothetical protein
MLLGEISELSLEPAIEGRFDEFMFVVPNGVAKKYVDAFSERQSLNKNCGGALWSGADGPRHRAGRSVTWRRGKGSLPDGWTVRALGPDGPHVRRGSGRSPTAPGSRSREGPRRGGEILGVV